MKLVFAHDTKFSEINGRYYTSEGLSEKVLTRYTDIFGFLTIIARVVARQKEDKGLSIISNPNINIIKTNLLEDENCQIEDYVKNCDALIIRLPSFIGNRIVGLAKKYKKPYLLEVVGCPWDALWNHSNLGKIVAPYMFLKTKYLVREAPYALYVTNEFLQQRYPCNGLNIGCSDVDLTNFDNNVLKKRIQKIRTMPEKIVIGTLAAVNVRYKGQEYVIEAISKLNKSGYDYEYELVGGGDNSYLRSVAKKWGISPKVRFLGTLPHEKVFDWIDTVDIYIQPSKTEGLPRALIEAMSRGCPALGSIAGGIPELLNNKFLFHNGTVDGICDLLKMMNKDTMVVEAARSFEKAKEYDGEVLDEKRASFYLKFKEGIKNND